MEHRGIAGNSKSKAYLVLPCPALTCSRLLCNRHNEVGYLSNPGCRDGEISDDKTVLSFIYLQTTDVTMQCYNVTLTLIMFNRAEDIALVSYWG